MGLQWREQLSVGNELIDGDHKHLIDLVNQAEESLKTKKPEGIKTVLGGLASYAKFHFAREELVSQAAGYPDVEKMHASHEALVAELTKLTEEMGPEMSDAGAQHLVTFVRDWLINHVIKEDLLMKPFLTKFSPKFDPRR